MKSNSARYELHGNYTAILGESPEIIEVLEKIEVVADTNATVLIQGETGTGKELVAYALHGNSSRSAEDMVVVNCASIPEHLLESELFGHEKGAFTGTLLPGIVDKISLPRPFHVWILSNNLIDYRSFH